MALHGLRLFLNFYTIFFILSHVSYLIKNLICPYEHNSITNVESSLMRARDFAFGNKNLTFKKKKNCTLLFKKIEISLYC